MKKRTEKSGKRAFGGNSGRMAYGGARAAKEIRKGFGHQPVFLFVARVSIQAAEQPPAFADAADIVALCGAAHAQHAAGIDGFDACACVAQIPTANEAMDELSLMKPADGVRYSEAQLKGLPVSEAYLTDELLDNGRVRGAGGWD